MGPHALNADFRHFPDLHPQQVAAFLDQLPVTFGRKLFIFIFFHEAFDLQVPDTLRPHPGTGLDDPRQFIHCEEALFHIAFRLHVRADPPAVAHDRPYVLLRNPRRQ